MQFDYKRFSVECRAKPDASMRWIGSATISRQQWAAGEWPYKHESGDLNPVAREDVALSAASLWAKKWVDENDK